MQNTQPLTEKERQKADSLFSQTIWLTMVLVPLTFILISIAIDSLNEHGLKLKPIYFIGITTWVVMMLLQKLALKRVQRAGLSRESHVVETVPKTASQFEAQTAQWYYPQRKIYTSILLGIGAVWLFVFRGLHSFFAPTTLVVNFLLIVGFFVCIHWLLNPIIVLNEEGVHGMGRLPWMTPVSWSQIAKCEVTRVQNYLGDDTVRKFDFKDEEGKSLLSISPAILFGLNLQHLDSMETEIKRRMTG